jgi:hypothetical protein
MVPASDCRRRVYAKVAAYAYSCNQHADAASCAADTANFCAFNADRTAAPCDADYAKALSTSKCATGLDGSATSVFSASCQAYWSVADHCAALSPAACTSSTLCAAGAIGACAFPPALGSAALLAYAAEAGTPLAADLQAAMLRCGKGASAAACAAAAPAVAAPQAAALAALKALALEEVAGDRAVAISIANSTLKLGAPPATPACGLPGRPVPTPPHPTPAASAGRTWPALLAATAAPRPHRCLAPPRPLALTRPSSSAAAPPLPCPPTHTPAPPPPGPPQATL